MASFTFGAGNARIVLRLPLYALGALATLVVPRSNRLWVFGSGIGPGEGALPLYRLAHMQLHGVGGGSARGTRLVWLATTEAELTTARELGLDAEKKGSARGFWLTLHARVLVVTHGFGDVNRFATRGGFVVQLWHGIPLKKLHLDSPVALRVSFLPNHRLVRALMARAYRLAGRGISLFPVASQLIAARIASAFGVAPDRIVVTGDPRDDVLLAGTPDSRRAAARALLPANVPADSRVVLYAPTWRDGAPDPGAPTADEWGAIAGWLQHTGAVLLVRTHPLGVGDYASGPTISDRIQLMPPATLPEVTPLLPAIDALITDYSSIAFDYSLVGGPIVFLAPDVESYVGSRGLYEPYRNFSGGRHVTSWEHALRVLDARWTPVVEHAGTHERWLRDENFDYLDGRATERVFAEILARTGIVRTPINRASGSTAEAGPTSETDSAAGTSPTARPLVTALKFEGAQLRVTVDTAVATARLEGSRGRVTGSREALDGHTVLIFPLLSARWGVDGLALPSGDYRLTLVPAPSDPTPTTRVTVTAPPPPPLVHPDFHATAHAAAGGLIVTITPPLADDERGQQAQRRLERTYRRTRPQAEDAVFFESFYGQSASCNPLGIDRALARLRPQTTRYWSVVDGSVAVPPGGVRIIEGSREWWHARGSSRVLVVNDWLRKRFRRRGHQHVLQTWHGTMLKRLALDRASRGIRTRLAVVRERSRWDALLAQNPYSAKIFRSAYAMRGPIWQLGYPRNDVLQDATALTTNHTTATDAVRTAVGVPAGARVVLYAPTWRDNRTEMVDYLDLASFASDLGDNHVLLVRGHSRTLRYGQDLVGTQLIDVTSYPSMADLLLIADVFVTDYSSAMFDFAGTGKPIVLFTPDLISYSTDLRGFYFDLLADAPGPVVQQRAELRDAILATRRADATAPHADILAAWRERFTPLDDGHAGERVVQRLVDEGWL